jgi:hypothetical protein
VPSVFHSIWLMPIPGLVLIVFVFLRGQVWNIGADMTGFPRKVSIV